ncbi:NUDIX hydrolase, partial [Paracoccus yeei]
MIFLVGALAHPVLRMRLAPGAVEVEGLPGHALQGGQGAGIAPDGWPALVPAQGRVPLWRTDWTPALTRYAHIFGLEPVAVAGRDILGVAAR